MKKGGKGDGGVLRGQERRGKKRSPQQGGWNVEAERRPGREEVEVAAF